MYVENPKNFKKKLLESISEFSKDERSKVNTQTEQQTERWKLKVTNTLYNSTKNMKYLGINSIPPV